MCGVNEAMAAVKIVGAVAGHQEKKRQARENAWANTRARMTADAAYLADLGKIETERGMAAREKYIADHSQYCEDVFTLANVWILAVFQILCCN